jgi:aryl sulfotransferase
MAKTDIAWPQKAQEIRNPMWDSTRWNDFKFRDGDVFIDSLPKAGTNWLKQIAVQLIYDGAGDRLGTIIAARLEMVAVPLPVWLAQVDAQTGRRLFDSHMPLDALPFDRRVKYIFVARDPRDIVWSAHNHRANYLNQEAVRDAPGWDPDVRAYYLHWLEHDDGLGLWGHSLWWHVRGWWDARDLPNVLLVHYNNLKADLGGEIRRIAGFLEIPIRQAVWPAILEHCSLDYMRNAASKVGYMDKAFREGAKSFFYKGTNGRWKDVLSAEEIVRCDAVAAKHLTPDCAYWLTTGQLPAGDVWRSSRGE